MNDIKNIANNLELFQTKQFGQVYEAKLKNVNPALHCNYDMQDVQDLYIRLMNEYHSDLSEFQIQTLKDLFITFDEHRKDIDPDRLKDFRYILNDDNEFLLYRRTKLGLANIIIHDDECVAFSYIPYNSDEKSVLEYFSGDDFIDLVVMLFRY